MTNLKVTLCIFREYAASKAALDQHALYMSEKYNATIRDPLKVVPREGKEDLEIVLSMDDNQFDTYNRLDSNGERDLQREWQKLQLYCYAVHMQRI